MGKHNPSKTDVSTHGFSSVGPSPSNKKPSKRSLLFARLLEIERQASFPELPPVKADEYWPWSKQLAERDPEYREIRESLNKIYDRQRERKHQKDEERLRHARILSGIWMRFGDKLTDEDAHTLCTLWNVVFFVKNSQIAKAEKFAKKEPWRSKALPPHKKPTYAHLGMCNCGLDTPMSSEHKESCPRFCRAAVGGRPQ